MTKFVRDASLRMNVRIQRPKFTTFLQNEQVNDLKHKFWPFSRTTLPRAHPNEINSNSTI